MDILGGTHNVLYWLFMLAFYVLLFQPYERFLPDSFSDSFINTWGMIFLMVAFFAWYGGSAERLEAMLSGGNKLGGIAQLLGGGLGLLLMSLVLNYVFIPIKNLLLKLHKYVNKEN